MKMIGKKEFLHFFKIENSLRIVFTFVCIRFYNIILKKQIN